MRGTSALRVVVAGGGVAGAVCASLLANAGQDTLLIEREGEPRDKICGEFVSHEAQFYLARLGIDLAALGAVPIRRLRVVHGDRMAEAALPFIGFGLSRRVLDEALLQRAGAAGAAVVRGHAIRGLAADGADLALDIEGVGTERTRAVFLATGKHDLRGARRSPESAPEELIGLKMYYALAPAQRAALRDHVEVLLLDDGYGGLQLVEGEAANLCLLIARARFDAAGRTWDGLVNGLQRTCPHLARRLEGAVPLSGRPLSIFRVPYGYVHSDREDDPAGLFRLGDQMGVIPSFCGDGVSIALHTAFAAAGAFVRNEGAAAYHRRMRRDVGGQIRRAGALYRHGRAHQRAVVLAGQMWPGAFACAARLTRIPSRALQD